MAINLQLFVHGLRITQALLAIIVLSLSGHVAHWWTTYYHAPSPHEVNFLIFAAVWSMLALAYLVLAPRSGIQHPAMNGAHVLLAVDGITAVFWFAGFVAVAVFLTGRMCSGGVCEAVEAAVVFAAFNWVAFGVTTGLAVMQILRTRREGVGFTKREIDEKIEVHEGV